MSLDARAPGVLNIRDCCARWFGQNCGGRVSAPRFALAQLLRARSRFF
jgi:hypothetical protein